MNDASPIACDLTAIPASERERHFTITVPQVYQSAREIYELPDGYAFLFAREPDLFGALARLVDNERRCCPFVGYQIEIEPGGERLWLRLTGGEGVKAMLQASLGNMSKAVRTGVVRTGGDRALEASAAAAASTLATVLREATRIRPGDR